MASKNIYKVVFVNQGNVYEIYARRVGQGEVFGFIEVEQVVFGVGTPGLGGWYHQYGL